MGGLVFVGVSLGTALDAIVLLSRNVFSFFNSEYSDTSWSSGPGFPWSICLSKTPSSINLVSLGAPAQSFLGAYALARLPLKHQFGFSWSSGPEFPWSICLSKTPSNINLVSLGAPAQSFLGAYALARLLLMSTWSS